MSHSYNVFNRFRKIINLSTQQINGEPIIEIAGNRRVLIEHHKGVSEYEKTRIVIISKQDRITVSGSELEIQQMSQHQLIISGCIETVSIERGQV